MSRFSNHWRTVSGVVGGFSAGAAVSVLLLRHYDNYATTAAATSAPSGLLMPSIQNEELRKKPSITRYDAAIQTSRALILQVKEEIGIPGVCVAVNINGETAWTEGFGFADVENCVPCTPKTVMRIASISKSLTMTALAKHWEMGKIDLDLPVQHYLPKFPSKTFNGKSVEITTRMLVSHLSGIRHWKGDEEPKASKKSHEVEEMYLNIHFKTVEDALSIFENDELVHKPGSKYLYSSPAWTLVSAVMEKASGKSYKEIMTNLCNELRLRHTRLDENGPLTRNRARYYTRNKRGTLINSPCVDNSCKWAGGGFQSTVGDLVKFGDAMLFCYQGGLSGFLKKDTIDALWTISPKTLQEPKRLGPTSGYGMGWAVTPALNLHGGVEPQAMSINHTGGAVGASSILLIVPHDKTEDVPTGVTVAITVNLQSVRLSQLAHDIAQLFWNAHVSLA